MKFLNVHFDNRSFKVGFINDQGRKESIFIDVAETERIKFFLMDCVESEQRLQAEYKEREDPRLQPEFMNFK